MREEILALAVVGWVHMRNFRFGFRFKFGIRWYLWLWLGVWRVYSILDLDLLPAYNSKHDFYTFYHFNRLHRVWFSRKHCRSFISLERPYEWYSNPSKGSAFVPTYRAWRVAF